MYAGSEPGPVVEDILKTHLHSKYSRFMIAYEAIGVLVPDPGVGPRVSMWTLDMNYG